MSSLEVRYSDAPPEPLNNRGFVLALLQAVLALVLGAALTITAYLVFSPILAEQRAEATREDARPWTFQGADLLARMGRGRETDTGGLQITELERGIDSRAIFSRRTRLNAEDYPFLEYTITGRHAGEHVYFIWRTAASPEEVHNLPLYWAGEGPAVAMPGKHPEWRGDIVEVGLDVYGDRRQSRATIESLALEPSSGLLMLRSIWADWTALRTWTQKSAHHLRGHLPRATMAPTVAVAIWAGAALLLLTGLRLLTPRVAPIGFVLTGLIAWVSLDLLWHHNLSRQLDETRTLFSRKTQHEKHLADREHVLYSYAQHLKKDVLPEPGVKIHLVHDSDLRGYRRLKMQYYLLPHNVFNFDRVPRAGALQPGDLILVLDTVPGLSYSAESGRLHWQSQSVPVTLLDDQAPGAVYRYGGDRGG